MHRNWRNYESEYTRRRNRSLYALLSMAIGLTFTILSILHPAARDPEPGEQPVIIQQHGTEMALPGQKNRSKNKGGSHETRILNPAPE